MLVQTLYVVYQAQRWSVHRQLAASDKRTTALAAIAGVANGTGQSANLRDFFNRAFREVNVEKHFKTFMTILSEMSTVCAAELSTLRRTRLERACK